MLHSHCSRNVIQKTDYRVTSSFATLLDHILINENKLQIISFVINCDVTDHFPVAALIHRNIIHKRTEPIFVRSSAKFIVKILITI